MIPETVLFATPETAAEVARAPAVAILIGGYDGSGNYGDIAQLDAALGMLARLEPGILLLPVLERCFLEGHRALSADFLHPPAHALYFEPDEGHEDGLLPLPAPANPAFAACYLYGGGYLNPSWGERKLAMLRAAEALLAAGGATEVCRLSSGLQVDAGFIAGLAEADAGALRSFELLGARDRASGEALAALGSASPIIDTSDDAVGALRRLPLQDAPPPADGRLHVNVHIAEHEWVTGRPSAMAGFYAHFVAELGRCAGLPVVARPVIAYLDGRIDERPAVGRLVEACAARGVEVGDPLVLRPASLAATLPELCRAAVTISCSYHVALTSLLLEVPAALLRDSAYYEQKATGLAEIFGLPPSFALSSSDDPAATARGIGGVLLDAQQGAALRHELAIAAAGVRERRARAESELLARLGAATAARLGELGDRLRKRSVEPAALLAQLARSSEDGGAPEAAQESEAPAQLGDDGSRELLAEILGSRSWKMTAPLRRAQALLRRRR